MLKSDTWIKEFGLSGGISPFNIDQVNPASFDVSLSNSWTVFLPIDSDPSVTYHCFDLLGNSINPPELIKKDIICDQIILNPGQVVLAATQEVFKFPEDVAGFLTLKSSLARIFLNHMNSNLINPGFEGNLVLEFHNCSPFSITLTLGQRVSQILFMELSSSPNIKYSNIGQYQKQGIK